MLSLVANRMLWDRLYSIIMEHQQIFVKVNVPVDIRVADLICSLNEVEGLQTIESCQGVEGRSEGYVYFYLGDWQSVCEFAFKTVAPALSGIDDATISVEVFSGSSPMGKIRFRAEELPRVASALTAAIRPRTFECFHGTGCKEPHS